MSATMIDFDLADESPENVAYWGMQALRDLLEEKGVAFSPSDGKDELLRKVLPLVWRARRRISLNGEAF